MNAPLVTPEEGQSLDGLVMAAACALGESSTVELARLAGVRWGSLPIHLAGTNDLRLLAEEIGLAPDVLTGRAYTALEDGTDRRLFNGVAIANRLIVKRARRFCPETLRDHPWHRSLWQLALFPFCETSWRLLAFECHACGAVQRFARAWGPELCDRCMRPLAEGTTRRVPPALREDLRLAVGLLHHDGGRRRESLASLPEAASRHGAGTVATMLAALAGVVDPTIRVRNSWRLIRSDAPPDAIIDAVAAAWRILSGWPGAALRLLDARLAPRPGGNGDGNGGATIGFLELGERYAIEPGARALVTELRDAIALRQAHALDGTAFGARAGLRVSAVAAARRKGDVACVFGLKNGKPHPFYPAEEADAIAEALRSCIRIETVATRLGCTHRAVEELVAIGDLGGRVAPADVCASTRMRIVRTTLDEFEARIVAARSQGCASLTMPLRKAMKAVGGRLKPWSAVLRDLAAGSIRFCLAAGGGPLTRRIRINPDDLDVVRNVASLFADDDPRFEALMSKKEAVRTLNSDFSRVKPLIDRWPSLHGPQRSVPVADVVDMARRLVFLGELAVRERSTAAKMSRRLRLLGVERSAGAAFDRNVVDAALGARRS